MKVWMVKKRREEKRGEARRWGNRKEKEKEKEKKGKDIFSHQE
jgi:hypothetical protein